MVVAEENSTEQKKCVFERPIVKCSDQIDRFSKEGDNYTKQFASLYVKRLEELYPILKVKLAQKWGSYQTII